MAQLTLHDMSIQEIERFSEPVLAKKFSRALAHACDIDPSRVRVLGFRPGSIKIIFEILPEGLESPRTPKIEEVVEVAGAAAEGGEQRWEGSFRWGEGV